MSYTVLARRYRSASFDEVIGQEQIARTLAKAIESGRIAHAFLFCGARGTGKTSTARILAKCLNCLKHDGPAVKPCNKCDSCLAIARGDDIDVLEIDAASHTGVDNIREMIANAHFRPARARFKVYIIDEVHMLSRGAFNALLKTLEEPPEHVKFILATTEPEKVPVTILSRCQRYDFRNISTRQITEHLTEICKKEKAPADEAALMLVAKTAAGSMRDALSLLERLLSVEESRLTVQVAEQLMGLPKWQSLMELTEAIGASDVGQTLTRAGRMLSAGMSADSLAAAVAEHLRDLLILRTCPADADLVDASAVQIADLKKLAEKFDPAALVQDITVLGEVRRHMRQGHGGRALLDAALARLAMADQFSSIDQLLGRVGKGGPAAPQAPAALLEKKKPVEPVAPPVSVPPVLPPRNFAPPAAIPAVAAIPLKKPAGGNPPGFPAARDIPPPRGPAPAPAAPEGPVPIRITQELTAELENDPVVGAVLRELGGRIVKVE